MRRGGDAFRLKLATPVAESTRTHMWGGIRLARQIR